MPMAPLLRLIGVIAYFWMAHRAIESGSELFAGVALGLLVFIVFVGRLLLAERKAILISGALIALIVVLVATRYALTSLLFVPTIFLALAASLFGRTLIKGRTPLLVTAASLVEAVRPGDLEADVRTYTTRQTCAWAVLLSVLAVFNLFLALVATPDGVLARIGHPVEGLVSSEAATRLMPWVIYLSVAGFLVGEFIYRQRRFPGRYKSAWDYVQKLAKVPMKSWQTAFEQP